MYFPPCKNVFKHSNDFPVTEIKADVGIIEFRDMTRDIFSMREPERHISIDRCLSTEDCQLRHLTYSRY